MSLVKTKPVHCAECGRKNRAGDFLCDKCVRSETVRRKYKVYLSSDFNGLKYLDDFERQLLFLWACGVDIRPYLGNENPVRRDFDNDDLLEVGVGWHPEFFKGAYNTKHHYLLYGEEPVEVTVNPDDEAPWD